MSTKKGIYGLHNMDVRQLREFLEQHNKMGEKFIDVTITSPPYFDVQSYGYKNQIGYGQEYNEYLDNLQNVFGVIHDVTKETGSLWLIVDTITRNNKFLNLPNDISIRCKNCGWTLSNIIIWKKNKTRPWYKMGLRNIFEYILFFTKSDNYKFDSDKIRVIDFSQLKQWWVGWPERYNTKGVIPTNVWEYPIPTQGAWSNRTTRHFNPLPTKLIERIILLTTPKNGVVFDPFAGSGTVLGVADFLDKRWFGFEMNSQYCKMFQEISIEEVRQELLSENRKDKELQRLQKRFEKTIKNLRLMKFPKVLMSQIYHSQILDKQENKLNTLFALSEKLTKKEMGLLPENKIMSENILLIFDTKIEFENLTNQIMVLSGKKPLSRFGIEPKVQALTKNEFIDKYGRKVDSLKLWLYTCGKVNKFHKKISYAQWLEESEKDEWKLYFKNGVPPIVSNVRVWKKIPKTLKSRKEQIESLKDHYKKILNENSN